MEKHLLIQRNALIHKNCDLFMGISSGNFKQLWFSIYLLKVTWLSAEDSLPIDYYRRFPILHSKGNKCRELLEAFYHLKALFSINMIYTTKRWKINYTQRPNLDDKRSARR